VRKSLGAEVEAMEDIEIRMTEILAERGVVKDSVVTDSDVKSIIAQLGEPKDFSSDEKKPKQDENDETNTNFMKNQDGTTKKFYRDTDNAVLGGVCAGIAAYTGWDVTIIRVLTVIFAIVPSFGFLILLYIVMWIIAPEARSVGEKLEMRGERVDLESIKKSAKKVGHEAGQRGKEAAARAQTELKKTAPVLARAFGIFFGAIGLLIVLALTIALILAGNYVLWAIVTASLPHQALIIVAVSLGFAAAVFTALFLLVASVGGLVGARGKGFSRSIITLVIVAVLLMIGAVSVGGSWVALAGRDGAHQAIDAVRGDSSLIIDHDGIRGDKLCIGNCWR
jgi:phage shock protein PspC (stress-responsive transcriptional regulator)